MLSPDERRRLEEDALQNATSFDRDIMERGGTLGAVISGEILDADADLAPGGLFKFNFSTVSIVGIPNTVLSSRIVDPGPDLIPRTADDVTS